MQYSIDLEAGKLYLSFCLFLVGFVLVIFVLSVFWFWNSISLAVFPLACCSTYAHTQISWVG